MSLARTVSCLYGYEPDALRVDKACEAIRSCLVSLAEVEGRNVTTIEGLSRDRSHPVQQAFVAEGAIQCGFCTPGMVIAAAALLARNAAPSQAEIAAAMEGAYRARGIGCRVRAGPVDRSGATVTHEGGAPR